MKKKYNQGFYEEHIKRPMDIMISVIALIILFPIFLFIMILVKFNLGSLVIFKQERLGYNERIFTIYKFRTMTDKKDEKGRLLPDEKRLTRFGKFLRASSLDELPELINILKGEMSLVGPRPLPMQDIVFMTKQQRRRHLVKPGLSGLAQVNGRNAISWESKLTYDLQYIKKVTFLGDMKIIFQTIFKALIKHEGITEDGMVTAEDFGVYLLKTGQVDMDKYNKLHDKAVKLLTVYRHKREWYTFWNDNK